MVRTPSRRNHRKNRCAQICRTDASKTGAVQLLTSSKEELVPYRAYSCHTPWWWIIDRLCQNATSMPLATLCRKPNGGIWRDQKRKPTRKRQSHDDKHLLEGPFHVKSGPGYIEPSSLHTLWRELKHFATKELLGCPCKLVVFLMLALITLKLLVEAACWFWRDSQGCHCWSCTGKVPEFFFQAVLSIWPIWAHISTSNSKHQTSRTKHQTSTTSTAAAPAPASQHQTSSRSSSGSRSISSTSISTSSCVSSTSTSSGRTTSSSTKHLTSTSTTSSSTSVSTTDNNTSISTTMNSTSTTSITNTSTGTTDHQHKQALGVAAKAKSWRFWKGDVWQNGNVSIVWCIVSVSFWVSFWKALFPDKAGPRRMSWWEWH